MDYTETIAIFNKVLAENKKQLNLKEKDTLPKLLIGIDPGHGGTSTGAVITVDGGQITERDINHKVTQAMVKIIMYLKYKGLNIDYKLTKENTPFVNKSLSKRAEVFKHMYNDNYKKGEVNVFGISIHHNGGGGDYGLYIHTIFEESSIGDDIARYMAETVQRISPQDRIVTWSRKYPSQNRDYYAINRLSGSCPTILSEYAFMDNPDDFDLIDTDIELVEEASYHIFAALGFFDMLADEDKQQNTDRLEYLLGQVKNIVEDLTDFQKELEEILKE